MFDERQEKQPDEIPANPKQAARLESSGSEQGENQRKSLNSFGIAKTWRDKADRGRERLIFFNILKWRIIYIKIYH